MKVFKGTFYILANLALFIWVWQSRVKAIVFGEFIKSDEYMNFAINDFANQNSEIPMYITNKIGHGKNNFPVVYNKKGLIDIKLSP